MCALVEDVRTLSRDHVFMTRVEKMQKLMARFEDKDAGGSEKRAA
jgi:hypothetical protein